MANYKRVKTSFVKNDPRINRNGRPVTTKDFRQLKDLSKDEFLKMFNYLYSLSVDQLKEIKQDPNTPVKELIMCSGILRAMQTGCYSYIQPYIEYIFGRPKQTLEHTGKDGKPISANINTNDRLNELLKNMDEKGLLELVAKTDEPK